MMSSTILRRETEMMTRSVLLPNKDGLLLDVFEKEFKAFVGHSFPYEKLGYVSMLELLQSMPEVVAVTQLHSGHILLNGIPDKTTQDIARMVSKQKPNEEGYNRKTIQVVQQEKNRMLKLQNDFGLGRFNPPQNLNPDKIKPEVSCAKLVSERNTKTRNLIRELVSDEEKIKLRAVLAPFPAGLPLSQYSREYTNFYGHDLRPNHFECESIAQFCAELPEIFIIGREGSSGYSGDWILHLAQGPEHQQTQTTPHPTLPQHRPTPHPSLPKHRSSLANIHVPDKVVANVKLILERYPEGIKKSKFLEVYQNLTGVYLNVKPFGFRKIDDFFHHLHSKGIFQMANSVLMLWISPCDSKSIMTPKSEKAESKSPVEENIEVLTDREDTIFMNVMKPGDDVEQQSLAVDMKIGDFMDIIVGEIFHPRKFWIQCKGDDTSEELDKLMIEMDKFYDVETAKMLQVPDAFLDSGLICATLFSGSWHRVRVTSVQDPTNVRLFYIDYGTVATAAKDSILYLDKSFGQLPAQAIPARLAGVKSPATASKFQRETSLRFLELVKEFHGDLGLSSIVVGIGQFVDLWLFTSLEKKFSINQILVDEDLASSDCDVCNQLASHENALPDCKWRFNHSISAIKEKKSSNLVDGVDKRLADPVDYVGDDSTDVTFDTIDSSGYDSKKSTERSGTFGIISRKTKKPSDIVRSILRKRELSLKQNKQLVSQGNPQFSSTKFQLELDSIKSTETTVKDGSISVAVVDETKRDEDAFTEIKKHNSSEEANEEGGTVGGAGSIECAPPIETGCLQAVRANINGNVTAVLFDKNETRLFTITSETMDGKRSSFGYVRKMDGRESDLEANQGGFVGGALSCNYDPKIEHRRLHTVRVNIDGNVTVVLYDKKQTRYFAVCLETMDGKRSSFRYPNKMEDDETEEFDEEVKQDGGTVGGDWNNKYDPKLENDGMQTFTAGFDGYEMTVAIDKSQTTCFTINLDTVEGKMASFGGPRIKPIGD